MSCHSLFSDGIPLKFSRRTSDIIKEEAGGRYSEARFRRRSAIRNSLSHRPAHCSSRSPSRQPGTESLADRRRRIARIKRQIEQGTYETKEKLTVALKRLLRELESQPPDKD